MRLWLVIFGLLCSLFTASAQYTISGQVKNKKDNKGISSASVVISNRNLWTIADDDGFFLLKGAGVGEITVDVFCLGYTSQRYNLTLRNDSAGIIFFLSENNLALNEVIVTAKREDEKLSTTYAIDRTAFEHMQIINVSDISALLPGEQTSKASNLVSRGSFVLRGNNSENGLAGFGTAVEVDGIRLSNNAQIGLKDSDGRYIKNVGIDSRSISVNNIESVEVITGIPSVEYGDLTNGVVKINSRKGQSRLSVEFTTKPNTKLYAVNKGVDLKKDRGILNFSIEHTKSNDDIASPYTAYTRNGLSLLYNKTFDKKSGRPVRFEAGVYGNLGGLDSKSDPDAFADTYYKSYDNNIRGSLLVNWLLNKPWITNFEIKSTVSYTDNMVKFKSNKSSSAQTAAIHSLEEGYFVPAKYEDDPNAPILLIPDGYWYETQYNASKPLIYTLSAKVNWAKKMGQVQHKILLGIDYSNTSNKGKGTYYGDSKYTPTWREYRYDKLPSQNNISYYGEDNLSIDIHKTELKLSAGIRADISHISNSEYGTVSGLSPRFNLKYIFWKKPEHFIQRMEFNAGWGKGIKLPSFDILYPRPTYTNNIAYAPGLLHDGSTYSVYYTSPQKPIYNEGLKWQYNIMREVGFEAKLKWVNISLSAFSNKTVHPYSNTIVYTPYSYNFTKDDAANTCPIPVDNRVYNADPATGIITISDKTGALPGYRLEHKEMRTFKENTMYINSSSFVRRGLEWVLDFEKIEALRTSFHIDGKYYYYKGLDEIISPYVPSFAQNMADGNPYKYIGFYAGGHNHSNGYKSKNLNMNVTMTTHIPEIRLIVSLRWETTFYNSKQFLSEYDGQERGFTLDNKDSYEPSQSGGSIYDGDKFTGIYPLYYVSYDDMETKIPFAEKFMWAKDNDRALYNELAKMVRKTSYTYFYTPDKISVYYSANLNVTKEIGKYASITFNARNFFNNMKRVKSNRYDNYVSLYGSNYIPGFYYGLSLKIKL